jgi:hypothetical protein
MLLIQVNLVINALDFNQIEHLVEVHKIDEIYLITVKQQLKNLLSPGFKYEFFISRFEFG